MALCYRLHIVRPTCQKYVLGVPICLSGVPTRCLYSLYCREGVFSETGLPVYPVLGNSVATTYLGAERSLTTPRVSYRGGPTNSESYFSATTSAGN